MVSFNFLRSRNDCVPQEDGAQLEGVLISTSVEERSYLTHHTCAHTSAHMIQTSVLRQANPLHRRRRRSPLLMIGTLRHLIQAYSVGPFCTVLPSRTSSFLLTSSPHYLAKPLRSEKRLRDCRSSYFLNFLLSISQFTPPPPPHLTFPETGIVNRFLSTTQVCNP